MPRSALNRKSLAAAGHLLDRWLNLAETVLLVSLLGAMIGFATFQIVARNVFAAGLTWADGLIQIAVLWVTMVGASVAAGSDRHIKIDVVPRFAGPKLRAVAGRLTALSTGLLCAALGWTSIEFIRWEMVDGTAGFGVVPAWLCESIIPIASAVMAARYLCRAAWPADDGPSE